MQTPLTTAITSKQRSVAPSLNPVYINTSFEVRNQKKLWHKQHLYLDQRRDKKKEIEEAEKEEITQCIKQQKEEIYNLNSDRAYSQHLKTKSKLRIAHPTIRINGKDTEMDEPNPN